MEHFKYPIAIPEKRERELIINLLVEILASINVLTAQLSFLRTSISDADFDKITKTLFDGKDKGMIDLIAAIEKKYGE